VRALWGPIRGLGRLALGYTETPDFRELLATVRFFAGGDQSVRDYGFQEPTPRTDTGLPIGGTVLLTARIELDSLFLDLEKWGRWGLAVFNDAGNAMDRWRLDDLSSGVGAGSRWLRRSGWYVPTPRSSSTCTASRSASISRLIRPVSEPPQAVTYEGWLGGVPSVQRCRWSGEAAQRHIR
jgi:hypothetical protein